MAEIYKRLQGTNSLNILHCRWRQQIQPKRRQTSTSSTASYSSQSSPWAIQLPLILQSK